MVKWGKRRKINKMLERLTGKDQDSVANRKSYTSGRGETGRLIESRCHKKLSGKQTK